MVRALVVVAFTISLVLMFFAHFSPHKDVLQNIAYSLFFFVMAYPFIKYKSVTMAVARKHLPFLFSRRVQTILFASAVIVPLVLVVLYSL